MASANSPNQAKATRWWWIRHAPVTVNNGRLYGQDDLPADTDDVETFVALARSLPQSAVLVTSDLQRTHQTARAIADAGLGLAEPIIEPDLKEQHFGRWQGRPFEEVRAELSERHPFWLVPAHVSAPGGESFADLADRTDAVVRRLTAVHAGRDIIAVAHGGTIRAALGLALGLDLNAALAFQLHNCSVTRIDFAPPDDRHATGGWSVIHVNHVPRAVTVAR